MTLQAVNQLPTSPTLIDSLRLAKNIIWLLIQIMSERGWLSPIPGDTEPASGSLPSSISLVSHFELE